MEQHTGIVMTQRSTPPRALPTQPVAFPSAERTARTRPPLATPLPPATGGTQNGTGFELSAEVLAELHWIASEGSPSLSRHARIILARNDGRSLSEIASILDVDRATVRRWLLRFQKVGLRGLITS